MSCIVSRIFENRVPIVQPANAILIPYTFENNQEPDDAGAKIHIDAPAHTNIMNASYGAGTTFKVNDNGRSADIVIGGASAGRRTSGVSWAVNRSVVLSVDPDAPTGATIDDGKIAYYNAAGETGPSCPLSVTVFPTGSTIPTINAPFSKRGSWQDWATQYWIYSYRVSLRVTDKPVTDWILYFDKLPIGTTVYDASSLWVKIVMDGTEGTVALQTPDGAHVIQADTPLDVDFQLLYPTTQDNPEQYNSLYDVVVYDIGT
ncbi:hypothetical protein [Paraburkholderia solisilvae]|uniref:Uncharacterized protein n=1 Tax=Paraburkholderia solisilvae TaxID=624376 RepID=A0A6J5DF18_9BURK|nr:hypothetical protein [Paraburkholderia solisilvae]CAB3751762.1 hypothetical protein LMG29739_01376 [Paraburkholderia solisilvae]